VPNHLSPWPQRYRVRGRNSAIGDRVPVIIQVDFSFGHEVDGDAPVHQAGSLRVGEQLFESSREADAVVCAKLATLADGEAVGEIQLGWEWHPGAIGVLWGLGEASVVSLDEAQQEGVGLFQGGDAGQAQLIGEAVLQGAPSGRGRPQGMSRTLKAVDYQSTLDTSVRLGRLCPAGLPGPRAKDQCNFTDPDSRIMKSSSNQGFDQDYNAQVAVDQESLPIVGASLSNHRAGTAT
jgi:hypothetical protein